MSGQTGMEEWKILRGVGDKWRCVVINGQPMRHKVRGRSVIVPGFSKAGFFVSIDPQTNHRWVVTESLCGLRIGYPARTGPKAVAGAVQKLWENCGGDEGKFVKKLNGRPRLAALPIWEPEKTIGGNR